MYKTLYLMRNEPCSDNIEALSFPSYEALIRAIPSAEVDDPEYLTALRHGEKYVCLTCSKVGDYLDDPEIMTLSNLPLLSLRDVSRHSLLLLSNVSDIPQPLYLRPMYDLNRPYFRAFDPAKESLDRALRISHVQNTVEFYSCVLESLASADPLIYTY